MGYQSVESIIDHSAHIYTGARIQRSRLGAHVIVGDFSRVDFSHLAYRVRIDRNNHLYHVHIGRHTYTGMNTVLMHATVGSFCSIAWNVSIGGANHDYTRVAQHSFLYNDCDYLRPNGTEIPYDRFCESLTIGSDVWVATGAVIRRGVTIGDGAVIGANAVVTRDVPPYMIVAGSPARVIKPRFENEIVEILLTLKWWEWNEKKIYAHFEALSSHPDIGRLRELMA